MFSLTNENKSWYIDDNINTYTESGQINVCDPSFKESNNVDCEIFFLSYHV